jgi:Holliday junction resolvasome RuvABC endonuclease subunit
MISIGIDQSYTSTGYCVIGDDVVDYGVISTDKEMDIHERATAISNQIIDVISKYPKCRITIEGLAFGMMGSATRDLAGLQFVIIHNIKKSFTHELVIVSPTSLKKFATGNGGSKKQKTTKKDMFMALPADTQLLFKSTHKITKGLYDITDAYWLAKYKNTPGENK